MAIGECGLDYHYDHSPRDVQREAFAAQIALANERALPLVIHTREAWDDTFDVLVAVGVPERVVFHCFTGGADEARRALDLGAFLSFSGIVTFKSADDVRAAATAVPRGPAADRDRQPVPGARSRTAAGPTGPPCCRSSGARLAELRGVSGGAPVFDDERGVTRLAFAARRLRSPASGRRTPAPTDKNRSNL